MYYYTGGYSLPSNRTLYGASGPGTFYISNVTCYGSLDDCNYEDNFSEECLSGDYDYVVQCYIYRSKFCVPCFVFINTVRRTDCYPGEIRLSDSEYYEDNDEGFTYISGYPVLCVDDELLPLCNSTMPQLLELTSICQATVNLTCKSCNSITMESMYYHTHRWFPWYSRLPNITVLFWWF